VQDLHHLQPIAIDDQVSWALEPGGKFSVSSLYRKINHGPSLPHEKLLWKAKLPLKIKIFLWQMAKGKMPVNEQINRRHGKSNGFALFVVQWNQLATFSFRVPLQD
jgi:hypothetical protein